MASRQSRMTVPGDTCSASAVSSTLNPPKYLISTTWPFRGSTTDSAFNASSSSTRSRGRLVRDHERLVQRSHGCAASTFVEPSGAGGIDQYATHDAGGHREEVLPVLPLDALDVDEAQIGFVDEGRWLKRVPTAFVAHVLTCDPPQFLVHERNELVQSGLVAAAPGQQQGGGIRRGWSTSHMVSRAGLDDLPSASAWRRSVPVPGPGRAWK